MLRHLVGDNRTPKRQFEFVQSRWVNDGNFVSRRARSDQIVGQGDAANDCIFLSKSIRRHLKSLPDFMMIRGGEHVFLPGIGGLRWLIVTH